MKLLTLSSFHSVSAGNNSLSAKNPVYPVTAAQTVGYIFSDTCSFVGSLSIISGSITGVFVLNTIPLTPSVCAIVGGTILTIVGKRTRDYLDSKQNSTVY
jgi:hypothetical protein